MGKERLASRYKNPKSKNQLEGARKAAIRGARRLWEGSGSAVWDLRAAPVPICLQYRFRRQNSQFHTPRQPVWIAPWPECKNPHRGSFAETNCGGRARTAISPLGKKLPESGGKKNASMPQKRELPTLPLRRVQTSPAAGNATMHGTVRRLIWASKAVTRAWQKCPPARGEYSTPRKRRPSAPFF